MVSYEDRTGASEAAALENTDLQNIADIELTRQVCLSSNS